MPNENNENKAIEREKIMSANYILAEQIKEYVEKVRKLIEAMIVLN